MYSRRTKLREEDLLDPFESRNVKVTHSDATSIDERIASKYTDDDAMLDALIIKASQQSPDKVSFYDTDDIYIKNKEREDVTVTDAIRRSVHTISNYYNTLGVFRDDFDKVSNDELARNSYYAMCEKALMDYMGSIEYKVTDSDGESVEDATHFLEQPNPQETFDVLLKMGIRDLIRYDAAIVTGKQIGRAHV